MLSAGDERAAHGFGNMGRGVTMTTRNQGTFSKSALQLTGNAHAVLPEINASFARGMTLQAWVRLDDLDEKSTIFACGDRPDNRAISVFVATNGDLVVETIDRPGSVLSFNAPKAVATRKWTHVSVVLTERGNARIVIDGRERASGKLPLLAPGSRRLGFLGRSLAKADETLRGAIADVRLWTRDLSNDEIEASRGRRLSGEEPELAAYWPLDCLLDGRLGDLSGFDRSAGLLGATVVAAADLPLDQNAVPSPAIALRNGDTIVATNSTARTSSGFTVQAWVRFDKFTAGACLFELGDGDPKGWSLVVSTANASGALSVRLSEPGRLVGAVASGSAPALGQWTHITVLVDKDDLAIFFNGERVKSTRMVRPQGPGIPPFTGYRWKAFSVGASRQGTFVDADVAEIRVFTKALSPRQVARSVARTMLGTESELAINWRLDENRGAVARNSGLLGNDANVAASAA